jgi:hypothetical protein
VIHRAPHKLLATFALLLALIVLSAVAGLVLAPPA